LPWSKFHIWKRDFLTLTWATPPVNDPACDDYGDITERCETLVDFLRSMSKFHPRHSLRGPFRWSFFIFFANLRSRAAS